MDRRTVFADGLVLARSVKVLEHGVLVAEPPDLWLMRDTDGDLRMDTKTRVTGQFGQRDVDVENNANGFDWGLDNRLRTAGQSRLQFRWKGGTLVAAPAPVRGQWGVTHDDVGTHVPELATSRRCTWTWSPTSTSPAIRNCCARAAATSGWRCPTTT